MDSFLNQSLLCYGFDEAVNGLRGESPFLIGTMFPQRLEEGMVWIRPGRRGIY
jgi:hypothetical protein